jgi:hypothetical protein
MHTQAWSQREATHKQQYAGYVDAWPARFLDVSACDLRGYSFHRKGRAIAFRV